MNRTLYMHVGPYKTGTTSIQKTLFPLRKKMISQNNLVYLADKLNHGPVIRNAFHSKPERLNNNLRKGYSLMEIKREVEAFKTKAENDFSLYKDHDFLISGEHISDLNKIELSNLKKYFNHFFESIKIIYFVRNPNDLISSDAQEAVKNGRDISGFEFKYILKRYKENIESFRAVFGCDNTRILKFEDAVACEEGFVNYFVKTGLGIDLRIKSEKKENTSLSEAAFESLKIYNSLYPEHVNGVKNKNRNENVFDIIKKIPGPKKKSSIYLSQDVLKGLEERLVWLKENGVCEYSYTNGIQSSNFVLPISSAHYLFKAINDL